VKQVSAWLVLITSLALLADSSTGSEGPANDGPAFSVGPLVALDGGDGEAVTATGGQIATLGAARATWWLDAAPRTTALPNISVRGSRWSRDGTSIFAGPGSIDVARGVFSAHPAFASLVQPPPPGRGSLVLHATSWSADGRYAAALLGWAGPRLPTSPPAASRVVVLDLAGGTPPVNIPADDASGVLIAGDRVVVAAPVVRTWTFDGREVAALPSTRGTPISISGGDGGPVLLVDVDWSIRVVDTATWTVRATWRGPFLDAVDVPGGLIALDFEGRLHAACLGTGALTEVGQAATGIRAAHLAATGDGRIVIMGAAAVPVHAAPFRLTCGQR
jgi:hypothetical protein